MRAADATRAGRRPAAGAGTDRVLGRRRVLAGAVGGLASLTLAPVFRPALAAEPLAVSELAEGFTLVTGAGGNVLVRSTSGGQVLVDSGAAAFAEPLIAALGELPGGPVATLINTHWHLDQTGANARLGRAGAAIVAHEKTRLRLATDYYLPAEDRYQPALPVEAQPTDAFYTTETIEIGGEIIDCGYLLQAHTDGDIYVHFRDANLIAVGDAVSPLRDPALDWFGGGWLGGRVDSLALLLAISDGETRFVPSYGPVVGRADVEAEHALMLQLFERLVELVRQGMSAEDILAAGIMDEVDRPFDDPLRFLYDAHKGLWAHHNTLSHDIV